MLVLTQLSVGAFTAGLILEHWMDGAMLGPLRSVHAAMALGFGMLALTASLFHLGRPQYAFRAVLGLRHSWLSREIVAFGAFAAFASLYAGAVVVTQRSSPENAGRATGQWVNYLGWSVAITGMMAMFCSVMIYVFTQRECWSFLRVSGRFALTSAVLGVAAVWLTFLGSAAVMPGPALFEIVQKCGPTLCWVLVSLSLAKLLWEGTIFRHLIFRKMTPLKRSALLMIGELSNATLARFALGGLGGAILPMILAGDVATLATDGGLIQFVVLTGLIFAACLAGELLERYLFFAACAAPRMPRGI
jgi:DMSO reductase anchor subunit